MSDGNEDELSLFNKGRLQLLLYFSTNRSQKRIYFAMRGEPMIANFFLSLKALDFLMKKYAPSNRKDKDFSKISQADLFFATFWEIRTRFMLILEAPFENLPEAKPARHVKENNGICRLQTAI